MATQKFQEILQIAPKRIIQGPNFLNDSVNSASAFHLEGRKMDLELELKTLPQFVVRKEFPLKQIAAKSLSRKLNVVEVVTSAIHAKSLPGVIDYMNKHKLPQNFVENCAFYYINLRRLQQDNKTAPSTKNRELISIG